MLSDKEYQSKIESVADEFIQNGGKFVHPKSLMQGGAGITNQDDWVKLYTIDAGKQEAMRTWLMGDKAATFAITNGNISAFAATGGTPATAPKANSFLDLKKDPKYRTVEGLTKLADIYGKLTDSSATVGKELADYIELIYNSTGSNVYRPHKYHGSLSSYMSGGGITYTDKYANDAPVNRYTLEPRIMQGGGSSGEMIKKTIEASIKLIEDECERQDRMLSNKHARFVRMYKSKGGTNPERLEEFLEKARNDHIEKLKSLMKAEMWARYLGKISGSGLDLTGDKTKWQGFVTSKTFGFDVVMKEVTGKDSSGTANKVDNIANLTKYIDELQKKLATNLSYLAGFDFLRGMAPVSSFP